MDMKQLAGVLLEVIQENRSLRAELTEVRSQIESLSSDVKDLRHKTGSLLTKTSVESKRNAQHRSTIEESQLTLAEKQKILEGNMEELKSLVKYGPPPLQHLDAVKDELSEGGGSVGKNKSKRISPKELIMISPVKKVDGAFSFEGEEEEEVREINRGRGFSTPRTSRTRMKSHSPRRGEGEISGNNNNSNNSNNSSVPRLASNDFSVNKIMNSGYTISAKSIFEIPTLSEKQVLLKDLKGLSEIRKKYEDERLLHLEAKVIKRTEVEVEAR
ncbi:hypothetical protein TrLO_g13514 [Triparma laevis f. longispina]|uniref:Uncharacterized protein n=1 Tax=Triparma laevis f. longispina TaxID=1714387 RepID=A0A9W7FQH9_9STRA|nr:hypothetical protein TrLO_g13514 [Triparma laevis f. longispina]